MKNRKLLIEILNKMGNEMIAKKEPISIYSHYDSWQEFAKVILELSDQLKKENKKVIKKLKMIFLPTSDWDDSGLDGYDPDQILSLINKL